MNSPPHQSPADAPPRRLHVAPELVEAPVGAAVSTDLTVSLAALLASCVPRVCDSLVVDIDDGGREYQLTRPDRSGSVTSRGRQHTMEIPFEDDSDAVDGSGFSGVATFAWHDRMPNHIEQDLVAALLDNAVRTVQWQRSELRARAAANQVDNLRNGLHTNRLIGNAVGILMSLHKITGEQAFDLLAHASQHLNRKVRDIAVDVVDTGWLDPGLQPRSSPPTRAAADTAAD